MNGKKDKVFVQRVAGQATCSLIADVSEFDLSGILTEQNKYEELLFIFTYPVFLCISYGKSIRQLVLNKH